MTRRDDSPRVFDVSRPQRVAPDPTSRPVIVGHHPMMADPMVKERPLAPVDQPAKVTTVPVITEGEATSALPDAPPAPTGLISHQPPSFSIPDPAPELPIQPEPQPTAAPETMVPPLLSPEASALQQASTEAPNSPTVPIENTSQSPETPLATIEPLPSADMPTTAPIESSLAPSHEVTPHVPPVAHPNEVEPLAEPHVDTSHLAGSLTVAHAPGVGPQSGYWRKPLFSLGILILLVFGYGIADAKTSLPLPFHHFRQEKITDTETATDLPATTPAPQPTAPPTSSVFTLPAGWRWYENKELGFKFAYPAALGTLTAKAQKGSLASLATPSKTDALVSGSKGFLSATIYNDTAFTTTAFPGGPVVRPVKGSAGYDWQVAIANPKSPTYKLGATYQVKSQANGTTRVYDFSTATGGCTMPRYIFQATGGFVDMQLPQLCGPPTPGATKLSAAVSASYEKQRSQLVSSISLLEGE